MVMHIVFVLALAYCSACISCWLFHQLFQTDSALDDLPGPTAMEMEMGRIGVISRHGG